MSSKTKNGPDYTGTLLRAYRPVECGEWFTDMAKSLWDIAGAQISFPGDITEEEPPFRLTLIGTGEFSIVRQRSMQLGNMCMKNVAKRAKQEAPKSFGQASEFKPCAINMRRAHEGTQLTLSFLDPQLDKERDGLKTGIDQAAGQWHKWHPNGVRTLCFAEIAMHISTGVLEEMQAALPSAVPTLPGVVRPSLDTILLDATSSQ